MPTTGSRAELPASDPRATGHDCADRAPAWPGLHPVPIIALGVPSQPVERMMGAQSAVYRLIVKLESIRLPWERLSPRRLLAALFAKPARY